MKFKSNIEVQAGLKDSSGSIGTSGQVLSSTGSNVSWINQSAIASDVQNQVKAGVAINKGQAVYVTGADGTNIIVGLASNTSEATSSKTLGLLNATVAINGMADVVQIGRLSGLNTIGATAGDPVWLGTNGNLIYGLLNKPYAPAHLVFIGIVTRVNANNGEIFVSVQNGFELNEIHDVDLKTNVPVNGDVLGFNGTLWVNKTIAQWLGYTPANASGTTNYVSKFTGATTLGNSQIFDNGQVNIGSTSFAGDELLMVSMNGTTNTQAINVKDRNASGNGSTFMVFRKSDDTFLGNIRRSGTSDALFVGGNSFLALGTGGNTETMRINSAGNVGIGTTSPNNKLSVSSGAFSGASTVMSVLNISSSQKAHVAYDTLLIQQDDAPTLRLYETAENLSTTISSDGGLTSFATTGELGLFVNGDSGAQGWAGLNGIQAIRIKSNGNVGIGTTSPSNKLDVNGNINVPSTNFFRYDGDTGLIGSATTIGGSSNQLGIRASNDILFATNGANERMRITSVGNVGIGATLPSAVLQINSSSWGLGGSNVSRMLQKSVGIAGDYEQHVILLHPIYNGTLIDYNKCSGTIYASRGGTNMGLINDTYDIDTASAYSSYNGTVNSTIGYGRLYTCDYNGVKYVALLPDYRTSAVQYDFDGYIRSTGEELKVVVYRLSNSGTIINSEVNNSLTLFSAGITYYQGNVYTAGSFVGNLSGTADQTSVTFSNSGATFESFFNSQAWLTDKNYLIYNTSDAPRGGLGLYTVAMNNWDAAYGSMFAIDCEPGQGIGYIKTKYGGSFGAWKMLIDNASTQTIGGDKNFTNNLGIGTTSPSKKLTVIDNSTYQLRLASTNSAYSDAGIFMGSDISDPYYYGTIKWDQGAQAVKISSNSASGIGGITFETSPNTSAPTERMRITSAGNVGIGTTSPNVEFTLYQASTPRFHLQNSTSGIGSTSGFQIALSSSDAYLWNFQNGGTIFATNNAERMRITSSGNVGIGTTSPGAKLVVYSGASVTDYASFATGDGSNTMQYIPYVGAGDYNSLSYGGGSLLFNTLGSRFTVGTHNGTSIQFGPTNTLILGNVGIGTTAPIHKLSVNGKIGGDVWSAGYIEFLSTTETVISAESNVVLGYAQNVVVDNEGSLGVGTISPSTCAIVEIESTNQGFLPPRMRTGERDNILGTPKPGLMIFNTDDEVIQVYTDGSGWRTLAFL